MNTRVRSIGVLKNKWVMVTVIGLVIAGIQPALAAAQACPGENGRIVVYFDAAGTQTCTEAGPAGDLVNVWIFGEGMEDVALFVSGAQFAVDYGPNLSWVADIPLFAVNIGNTKTGYSVGFGTNPQPGAKFEIVRSICMWTNDCGTGQNVEGPVVVKHPLFPDPCPVVARFPDQATFGVFGASSSTCGCEGAPIQVTLDIKPGSCPNPMNIKWFNNDDPGDKIFNKGGVLPVAILGTDGLDVADIDDTTLLLEGVAPVRHSYEDVAAPADKADDCDCSGSGPDGITDLTLKFKTAEVAEAIGEVSDREVRKLTLTGQLLDGTDIEGVDCVVVLSREMTVQPISDDPPSLGTAIPNPFNPVTRIPYYLPEETYVTVTIFDVRGTPVETLVASVKSSGHHVVEWRADRHSSGIYFYRMSAGAYTETRKMILLK